MFMRTFIVIRKGKREGSVWLMIGWSLTLSMPVCGFAGIVKAANAPAAFKLPSSVEAGHQDAAVAERDFRGFPW